MIRIVAGAAVLLLFAGAVDAQSMEEKYKAKLEKKFMKSIEWVDSLEKAQAISKKTGKPIFGYFTRSYSP